jgi:hypothetical protein
VLEVFVGLRVVNVLDPKQDPSATPFVPSASSTVSWEQEAYPHLNSQEQALLYQLRPAVRRLLASPRGRCDRIIDPRAKVAA